MNDLKDCVDAFVADVDIEETMIPYGSVAVDIISGKQHILRQGSIVKAVMASCAMPGFMSPITWSNMVLVDRGILNPLPVRHVKEGGIDLAIAVDEGSCLDRS